jgi:hypothetical protein
LQDHDDDEGDAREDTAADGLEGRAAEADGSEGQVLYVAEPE